MRSLIIIHNGFYMKEVSPHISSAAVMILCFLTGCTCKCTIAKYSADAGSYRGEILGAILAQLIYAWQFKWAHTQLLWKTVTTKALSAMAINLTVPCLQTSPMPTSSVCLKDTFAKQPFTLKSLYVALHADDIKSWRECLIKERINIKVDHLAKKALKCAHATGTFFDGQFPFEEFQISTNGVKVTGEVKPSLETHWGRTTARSFLDWKKIVALCDFDSVWWSGVAQVMAGYQKMFRIFFTKQVLGWCGLNSKCSLWDTSISNICPNCSMVCKTSKHMT